MMMNNEQPFDRLSYSGLPGDDSPKDEPRDDRSLVTAYALGELRDVDIAEMEARLLDSADENHAVSELARIGKLLRRAAAETPSAQPSAELRAAILAELANPVVRPAVRLRERFPQRRVWLRFSLAASLAVVCGTLAALTNTKHGERTVARTNFLVLEPRADGESDDDVVMEAEQAKETPPLVLTMPTEAPAADSGDQSKRLVLAGQTEDRYQVAMPGAIELKNGSFSGGAMVAEAGSRTRHASQDRMKHPVFFAGSQNTNQAAGANGGGPGGMLGGAQRANQPASLAGGGEAGADSSEGLFRFKLAESRLERKPVHYQLEDGTNRTAYVYVPKQDDERRSTWFYVPNGESYSPLVENSFQKPTEYPLSTFSIDVDTASYANVRRFLNAHAMPPADAVRVEELINYFPYAYPQPEGDRPFSVTTDVADCPWNAEHRLLRVGLKGREVAAEARPAGNLVFLLDVSGSMEASNKLPLVKEAMYLLTEKLTENDRVAIVVYAGNSGLALPPTNGANKAAIRAAIEKLAADGSTNGGQGLQTAYETAQAQFIKGGINRVILATDGDFNVGVVNQDDLVNLVAEKAKGGVFLTALGFGMGNLKDGTLEKLADNGNGNYAYIDTLAEARRVLVEQLAGTLVTIAKDVKLQIEFNPAQASAYRLIGYENRIMPPQDFHDDRKDAGEIGAGHTVTALYEIVPAASAAAESQRSLKYQPAKPQKAAVKAGELATIQLRYKEPEAAESRLIEHVVGDARPRGGAMSGDFQFAAAVAAFGMLLRDSPHRGAASYPLVLSLAEQGLSDDPHGYRSQFVELVRQARDLAGASAR